MKVCINGVWLTICYYQQYSLERVLLFPLVEINTVFLPFCILAYQQTSCRSYLLALVFDWIIIPCAYFRSLVLEDALPHIFLVFGDSCLSDTINCFSLYCHFVSLFLSLFHLLFFSAFSLFLFPLLLFFVVNLF